MPVISVEYDEVTGLWMVLDNFNDPVFERGLKKDAVEEGKRFASSRALSLGGVDFEIYNKDGSLSRTIHYS